jgi:HAD superfamily hydrolase (TIGR01493 family)
MMNDQNDNRSRASARRQIKAIVFDFWRTLCHSQNREPVKTLEEALKAATPGHHASELNPLFLRLCRTIPFRERHKFVNCIAKMFGYHVTDAVRAQLDELCREETEHLQRYPDVADALPVLGQDFKLACLINGWPITLDANLQKAEILRWIEPSLVLCSCDAGVEKPDGEIFTAMRELLGCRPEEILMVGDQPGDDVQGALDAGWHARHIVRAGEERSRVDGVKVISSLHDLLNDPLLYEPT